MQSKNRAVQVAVLAAGSVFNLVFAWILLLLFKDGSSLAYHFTLDTLWGLKDFFLGVLTGKADLTQVTGPVGLVGMVGTVSTWGLSYLVQFTALISINLAFINLLPIPALDGGRILFVLIEALTRRRIPTRVFNIVNNVSFALLILLMILITGHDIGNI